MLKTSLLLISIGAAAAFPQSPGAGPGRQAQLGLGGPVLDGSLRFLGAQPGRPGPLITGAPYSADAVTEVSRILSDGNTIHQTSTTHIYRDSQGRTRREPALTALSSAAPGSAVPALAFINDPVAGANYALDLTNHAVTKTNVSPPPPGAPRANRQRRPTDAANSKIESLGRQLVSGVLADGTRTTVTIPAGQIGNTQPIQIVRETWYSPELQLTVLSKRSDPRSGDSVFQLNNLSRAEPPSTLFVVPADFRVTEQTRGMGPRMRNRGAGPQ